MITDKLIEAWHDRRRGEIRAILQSQRESVAQPSQPSLKEIEARARAIRESRTGKLRGAR